MHTAVQLSCFTKVPNSYLLLLPPSPLNTHLSSRRLLDKYEVYERQAAEEVGSGEDEMEEVLTPDERKKAESVKRSINK